MEDAEGSRHYAAGTGRVEAMRMLVQQLARTRTQRWSRPLHYVADRGWMDAVRVLVQQLSVDKEGAWFSRCIARQTENGLEGAGAR